MSLRANKVSAAIPFMEHVLFFYRFYKGFHVIGLALLIERGKIFFLFGKILLFLFTRERSDVFFLALYILLFTLVLVYHRLENLEHFIYARLYSELLRILEIFRAHLLFFFGVFYKPIYFVGKVTTVAGAENISVGKGELFGCAHLSVGYNGHESDFSRMAEALTARGIGAFCFTFCGGSTRDASGFPTTEMTLFTEKEDLLAAVNELKNRQNVAELFLFGASMGGAMGAVLAIGGAAGLTAAGATITGFSMSTSTAFALSGLIGIGAGMASYSAKALFAGNWNAERFAEAGLMGLLNGIATYWSAFVGGKHGVFNSYLVKQGGQMIASATSKFLMSSSSVFGMISRITNKFGADFTKLTLGSGIAAMLRWIINHLFV